MCTIGLFTGKQVKQVEKATLAAVGQGDVLFADIPAIRLTQQCSERFYKHIFALWTIVIGHGIEQ
ncbi:Uncharacterised protein [Vibrio cholerae]|uniref:Uncharacterized protein n=1 Tax=Vibrio cholerae TaxID=666 RepID=A0A656A3J1_VIBCL|nr:Uncharacterised protein [Vibrio cholerae]CSA86305.1 Uncharacterised protein [Vibrio cholerae]CSA97918.1 Uncharacterised protein [Vibrio cholerae]CSB00100.1 Uncharacterised protein [Vibrio cholerae]CSB03973.1 Uncharacterised protein [Vibrio cholerae]